jgi:hypothetical protein
MSVPQTSPLPALQRGVFLCAARRACASLARPLRVPHARPLILLASLLFGLPAIAGERVALVVGNSSYQHVAPLDNPMNDAKLMADTLRELGFTLIGGGASSIST